MNDRRDFIMALMLVVVCLACALRAGPGDRVPARIPLSQVEPWMADALPGIGVKTRSAMANALRHGQISKLPARAQAQVSDLFDVSSSAQTNDE